VFYLGRLLPHPQILERLASDVHSSLLPKYVDYGLKRFYNIGTRTGAWMKTRFSLIKKHFCSSPEIREIKLECFSGKYFEPSLIFAEKVLHSGWLERPVC
jgi:hypothetical protein